jgi:apolipoprotein N-acyltransferase
VKLLPKRWLMPAAERALALPATAVLLPPAVRVAAGLLRAASRAGLLGLALALLLDENLRSQTLAQLRGFAALVLAPEAIAFCLLAAYRVRLELAPGRLLLRRGAQQLVLPLKDLLAVEAWRLPLPTAGATLRRQGGGRWLLAGIEPALLAQALAASGGPAAAPTPYAQARAAGSAGRLATPWAKFVLLPLLLALPAFHLHQHIAYGSGLGEFYSHGLRAYLIAFALWWAAWTVGVVLFAGCLRLLIEAATGLSLLWRPAQAAPIRWGLERAALLLLYLGLPAWLALRALN